MQEDKIRSKIVRTNRIINRLVSGVEVEIDLGSSTNIV